MNTPELAKFCLGMIFERIRNKDLEPFTVPMLVHELARMRNNAEGVVMVLNAFIPFTDMEEETWALSIQGPYERHDDATLARMAWRELLAGACRQSPAHG